MNFLNVAAYKFIELGVHSHWRDPLKARALELGLKGTILLSPEGINFFLAGSHTGVAEFVNWLRSDVLFASKFDDLVVKESLSERQPFRRMLVKLKKEIITMRHPTVRPQAERAPSVAPAELRRWLDSGYDDAGREVVLLDTRNAFEVELGSFEGARDLALAHFGEFPDAIRKHADSLRGKAVVTFCTGGIRCEKAALFMHEIGLDGAVQLDGGILKYFEEAGGAHWQGECFVFDDRVALDTKLNPTATRQCYACRAVVAPKEQRDRRYVPGISCPNCAE